MLTECTGQDPQYAKTPAWAKKEGDVNTIPATESHTGEGPPGSTADGKAADAQEPPDGDKAPAAA